MPFPSGYPVLLCLPYLQLYDAEGVCTYEGLPPSYTVFAFEEEEVALADAQREKADVVFDSSIDNSDPKQAAFLFSASPGEWITRAFSCSYAERKATRSSHRLVILVLPPLPFVDIRHPQSCRACA